MGFFDWFTRSQGDAAQLAEAIRELRDLIGTAPGQASPPPSGQLAELTGRIEACESAIRVFRGELDEHYGKVRAAEERMRKRAERAGPTPEEEQEQAEMDFASVMERNSHAPMRSPRVAGSMTGTIRGGGGFRRRRGR